MMDSLLELLKTLNTLSPLAVIGLLSVIVFMLVKAKAKNLLDMPKQLDTLENNHLSGLPEMATSLGRIEMVLQNMNDNIIYIRARINGK